jgi:hypothetical protein
MGWAAKGGAECRLLTAAKAACFETKDVDTLRQTTILHPSPLKTAWSVEGQTSRALQWAHIT